MTDSSVLMWILSIIWLPSVVGLLYLWQTYFLVRHMGDQWLLQTWCFTATPVTIAMIYVSWATWQRANGTPIPNEFAMYAGLFLILNLAWVVPLKAFRVFLARSARSSPPEIPVNGKGNGNGSQH